MSIEFVKQYLMFQSKRATIKILTPNRSIQMNIDIILFIYNKLTAHDSQVICSGGGPPTPLNGGYGG